MNGCRYLDDFDKREFITKCGHLLVQGWEVEYVLVDFNNETFIVHYVSNTVFETVLSFDAVFGCWFILGWD